MTRTARILFMIACFVITLACGTLAQSVALTATSTYPTFKVTIRPTDVSSDTPTLANTALSTTSLPTAMSSSPTVNPTDAFTNALAATAAAKLGFSLDLMNNRSLYTDPVGTPVAMWHDIPIMSQAIDGQEFTPEIYSYKANATLEQAQQFYTNKIAASGWNCLAIPGSSGTDSAASHDILLTCGTLSISISSFDNDTKHVLVILSIPR